MGSRFAGNIQPALDLDEHANIGNEDGVGAKRVMDVDQQIKIVESGGYTYVCFANVGTPEATAEWKVFRVDSTGNKMYADANCKYDNVASDPASLTYSYS